MILVVLGAFFLKLVLLFVCSEGLVLCGVYLKELMSRTELLSVIYNYA